MSDHNPLHQRHFTSAQQSMEMVKKLQEHHSYRLAFNDPDFLIQDDLRAVRLQLEYLKPQMVLEKHNVQSTIVVFGSARFPSPEQAALQLEKAEKELAAAPDSPTARQALQHAIKQQKNSRYYDDARTFSRLVTEHNVRHPEYSAMVISGGGPGVMEAANRGATDAGGQSIGLNIILPKEQQPNPYITPEFCFQFHYFAIRKMHFLQRARALVAFPGGFGTLDELFETLTLIQTRKAERVPIVLYDTAFWQKLINFDMLAEEGLISPADLDLIQFVDTPQQAWQVIQDFYQLKKS